MTHGIILFTSVEYPKTPPNWGGTNRHVVPASGWGASAGAGLPGLACVYTPVRGQRTRHRQGGGGGGGPSAAAAGRASIEEHKLRGVGAHQQEQNYQGWPARTPPCAGSARGTDRAGEEEGGHPPRRQAGQASPCSTCERLRRFSQSSTGLACVRHAVHRLVRRAAGVKKVGSAPCRSAGEGRRC